MVHGQHPRSRRLLLPLPVHVPGPLRPGGPGLTTGTKDRPRQRTPPRNEPGRLCPVGSVFDRDRPDGPDRAEGLEAHQLPVTSTPAAPGPAWARRHVIVVGAAPLGGRVEAELQAAGVTDVTVLPCGDVASSVFDDGTDTWELRTASGETFR